MPHKLLLADDSLTIQKVVELVLANENFEIKTANDGQTAWSLISTFKPDIVLADIDMPKLNGYELCDRIKNDMATAEIPVILLAGAFEPFDEQRAKDVLADDFIIKPFESQELISKVKALISSKPASDELTNILPQATEEPKQEDDISWDTAFEEAKEKQDEPKESEPLPEPKQEEEEPPVDTAFLDELQNALNAGPPADEVIEDTPKPQEPDTKPAEPPQMLAGNIQSLLEPVKDNIPEILKEAIKEAVTDLIAKDLKDEIRAVIKTAVPEIAERIITKEIEKITSGMR